MRRKIVAGNWKMNKDLNEALGLVTEIKGFRSDAQKCIVCVWKQEGGAETGMRLYDNIRHIGVGCYCTNY